MGWSKTQMETLDDVILGARYRDTVTGFEGVATGRVEFLNGCVRVTLERLYEEHELKELTFDVQRLVLVAGKRDPAVTRTGGARPNPPRSGSS